MFLSDWLNGPLPWYVAGPLIGLMVPLLLLVGNKSLGISSSMRHICAATVPAKIPFFQYEWKKELWNLFFVGGILLSGVLAGLLFPPAKIDVHPDMQAVWSQYGITNYSGLIPQELFSWDNLFTLKGFTIMALGGFLVGFGTRYAGGCTSGHAIMGLSALQLPSLIATICFMIGGFISTWLIVPLILG
jgi:uncharacterized membrane protein YedE/YeeE